MKRRIVIRIAVGILSILIVALGLYCWNTQRKTNPISTSTRITYKTYKVPELNVQFDYPSNWKSFNFTRKNLTKRGEDIFEYSSTYTPMDPKTEDQFSILAADTLKHPFNPNWSKSELDEELIFWEPWIILVQKLSEHALLAVSYTGAECSTFFTMKVYSPFTSDLPTLNISLPYPQLSDTEIAILNEEEARQRAQGEEYCFDLSGAYQRIVNNWSQNGFPDAVKSDIAIAQTIADSVKPITQTQ